MNHTEQTFIAIKSESIQRGLIGEFISRFERRGLKLVACKIVVPTRDLMEKHYYKTEDWLLSRGARALENYKSMGVDTGKMTALEAGRKVQQSLVNSFVGKPVLAMVWEGVRAVALGRKTVGTDNPEDLDVGTIRGDYMIDSYELARLTDRPTRSLVHASGTVEEARDEIANWFRPAEIISYPLLLESILQDNNWGLCQNLEGKI